VEGAGLLNEWSIVSESAFPEAWLPETKFAHADWLGLEIWSDTEFCNVLSVFHLIPEFTRHSHRWSNTLCPRSRVLSGSLNLDLKVSSMISILSPRFAFMALAIIAS
jgi:hypothetical protein